MGNGVTKACCLTINKEKRIRPLIKIDNQPLLKTRCRISTENIYNTYNIHKKIGKGFFSTVKLANKKDEPNINYAVKIIHKSKVDTELHKDFLNELNILENLDHPNVIKLYEVYEDEYNYYLVMEYLSGGDIFQRIEQTKNLNEKFIADILHKIISAINYCHSIGICHRDIKPENILFADKTEKSDVKIVDFGLSKKFNSEHDDLMHSFLGTPYFVAPEVIRKEYDFNCDMWSIGATAFMLFTGYPPFPDNRREAVLKKILKEPPKFNAKVWDNVSQDAKNFVESLLVKDPRKRINPQQALFHPFLKHSYKEVHSEKNLDKEILTNIAKFQNPLRFKKLVLGMLANSLPPDELQNLANTFNAMDLDHEGFISMDELKKAFHMAKIHLNDEEINGIIDNIDSDKNGKLNYSEYLVAALNIKKGISNHKQRLIKLFKNIDSNNSGYINVDNLKEYIMKTGREVENADEVLNILSEVSKDHNGHLTVDEFIKIIESD